jgi:bifunctional aspartokinase / homoserine dehydrogenase 1
MKLLKFGGSSIATGERIINVIDIIESYQERSEAQAVVVSAFGGVTDRLIDLANTACAGDENYKQVLEELVNHHVDILKQLVPALDQSAVLLKLRIYFNDLEDALNGVFLVRELSDRLLDKIMSFGELLSACIVSEGVKARKMACSDLDSRQLVRTDSSFGSGRIDFAKTYSAIRDYFRERQELRIVTGFIASDVDGDTVTLGRGGSDYTASIFGVALGAEEIEIWSDVDGMMTADPSKVAKAFSQEMVSYQEAMELSHFGAKVIYPPAMQPAMDSNIPIRIRNTFNREFKGTLVSREIEQNQSIITGVSSISSVALLRVQGSGMVGVAGISMRLFGALAESGISVILITQASSEHTICLAVKPEDALSAKEVIDDEFELEIGANLIDPVVLEGDLSIVSVVGENMRRTPGIAGRVFHSLGKNGVNIVAIAQGSSELNISAVISSSDEVKALNALHERFFFPDTKSINIFLVGVGLIGSALLKQIESHFKFLEEKHSNEIKIIGIANSKKMLISETGIQLEDCKSLLENIQAGSNIEAFIKAMKQLNLPNSVFVDCTASEQVVAHYEDILRSSISVVTPNKKAQSASFETYLRLKELSAKRDVEFLFETSVGAGLPVINTLNDLLKSGDKIVRIEAVLSGTLSYIFNSYTGDKSFSEIVHEAREAGYTEPDPRDDLNGLDVARKILILARETGVALEIDQIEVENLVPENCRETASIDEFFKLLKEADPVFEEKRCHAASEHKKLCYIASLEEDKARVVLEEVDSTHPFYNLSGSDNIISFTTGRYYQRPLVVKGPGAGAEVTAAGVFADIIRVAN